MNPDTPVTLIHIKNITGISRNHLADIFGRSISSIARWEVDPSTIPGDAVFLWTQLQTDFAAATELLDTHGHSWDNVIPARTAAMKLGVSPHTLASLLSRKRIRPIDLGLLGDFITTTDLHECKRP